MREQAHVYKRKVLPVQTIFRGYRLNEKPHLEKGMVRMGIAKLYTRMGLAKRQSSGLGTRVSWRPSVTVQQPICLRSIG